MPAAMRMRMEKAEKHNKKIKTSKKYAAKFKAKMNVTAHVEGGFNSLFNSIAERENWLEQREQAKRDSMSSFY